MNRVQQYTPYGNTIWHNEPNTDNWSVSQTLSPNEQRNQDMTWKAQGIYGDAALNQLGQAKQSLSNQFQSNVPGLTEGALYGAQQGYQNAANNNPNFDSSGRNIVSDAARGAQGNVIAAQSVAGQPINTDYNSVRQGAIDAANSRLRPQQDQDEENLRSRLLNSGITEGSQAWNNSYRQFNNSVNDSRQQTILNAENLAGQSIDQTGQLRQIPIGEQAQIGQMQANAAGIGGQQQQQDYQAWTSPYYSAGQMGSLAGNIGNLGNTQMQQQLQLRDQPVNEAAALLSGQQIQGPQFMNVPQTSVAPTDVMGAYGLQANANNQAYQAKAQQASSGNSGAYGAIGSIAAAAAIAF